MLNPVPTKQITMTTSKATSGSQAWVKTNASATIVSMVILKARIRVTLAARPSRFKRGIYANPGQTRRNQNANQGRIGDVVLLTVKIPIVIADANITTGRIM
jgi:hypothetical protein